ncbi:polyadenylate-binding protein-interacting protein 2 isoform X1 [Drosophila mojavensis]|nr:polyadenylate-binding protein-interacting protein 2 isoform X1 [Drosophila mojavensis]
MLLKVPSVDWTDQIVYVVDDDESLSDFDDEPDFSEYMWMENEEEFDKNELQRLEEEDIMQECFEAMIEDELEEQINEWEKAKTEEQNTALSALPKSQCNIEKSVLNPMADEFVPLCHQMDFIASCASETYHSKDIPTSHARTRLPFIYDIHLPCLTKHLKTKKHT